MIAVLFARPDSIYKTLPGCDVYDEARDARSWPGGSPLIAHPPCRLWSRMRRFSTAPAAEKGLALWGLEQVKRYGGVLEHPATSSFWKVADLSGGFVVALDQFWFGHPAEKRTKLFIAGILPSALPPIPFKLGEPEFVVATSRRNPQRKRECSKRWRSATPPAFAAWLCSVARMCGAA